MAAPAYPTRFVGDVGIVDDQDGGIWLFQTDTLATQPPTGVRITRAEALAVMQALRSLVTLEGGK